MPNWITVGSIPLVVPMKLHWLAKQDDQVARTHDVVCWLIQHQFSDGLGMSPPVASRVISGILSLTYGTGTVRPANTEELGYVGIYPVDSDRPNVKDLQLARQRWQKWHEETRATWSTGSR
jgi:hypothetical protein